ncbi:hypothetical protein B0H19DRAFT_662564 [Mycena capillaripes]|nr:hypothetical protein B0H19DRAFT_662564 [Mycena capillaripes]
MKRLHNYHTYDLHATASTQYRSRSDTMALFLAAIFAANCLVLNAQDVAQHDPTDPHLFRPHTNAFAVDLSIKAGSSKLFSTIPGLLSPQRRAIVYSRQEETCAYPVMCAGGTRCCPAGTQCCPIHDCCPTDSNCRSELGGTCCPKSAQTCGGKFCADPGSECCSSYVCDPGFQCNEKGGGQQCCEPSDLHCNDACCPPGSACASIAGYCSSIRVTTQTRTTTSTSTSTGTLTRTSSAATTTGCTPSTNGKRLLEARQRPFPDYCLKLCNVASRQELPVWEISSVPGETDQLVYSMCYGIITRARGGLIQSGLDDGEDILEYNGKGVRNETDCRGYCQDVSAASGLGVGSFQCDEYPPATLNPVGGAQTRWCVPRYQNSGTQGPMLSNFLRRCGLGAKDKVLVKINGGCNKFNFPRNFEPDSILDVFKPVPVLESQTPTPPVLTNEVTTHLLQRRATVQLDAFNGTLRNPNGDLSLTYVAVEIDELADGHYTFQVSFEGGTIDNFTVMNKYGDEYATALAPSGSASLSFNISDGSNLPAALIAWTTKAVNVTYSGSGILTTNTTANNGGVSAVIGPFLLLSLWTVMMGWLCVL